MNEWMNEWMNKWINEYINKWMNECMDGWIPDTAAAGMGDCDTRSEFEDTSAGEPEKKKIYVFTNLSVIGFPIYVSSSWCVSTYLHRAYTFNTLEALSNGSNFWLLTKWLGAIIWSMDAGWTRPFQWYFFLKHTPQCGLLHSR